MLIDEEKNKKFDYPHVEGTSDPIGRFERFISGRDEHLKNLFYSENFLRLFPDARIS